MVKRIAGLIFFTALLSGCAAQGPEELDRLIKEDPVFRQMIGARDQARGQILLIKKDLLEKKRVLDVQIGKLRADYDTVARLQNKKIQQYKALIAASANTLQRDIDALTGQLAAKEKELSEYQKTLVDIHKVLREGKGIHFSQEERQNFEERTLMLSEKIRPLADEVQELKLQIRLKKQKVGYLN